jgi:hypothetical protein
MAYHASPRAEPCPAMTGRTRRCAAGTDPARMRDPPGRGSDREAMSPR